MKNFFVFIMCIVLICAMSVTVFAESEESESLPIEETTSEETIPEETIPEETIPEETTLETETTAEESETISETETISESETISAIETLPPETTEPTPIPPEQTKFTSEEIVAWIKAHFEEISVVVSLLANMIYMAKKHKLLNKSISDTNHNAITVSENSDRVISEALKMMQNFKESSEAMIQRYKESSEEEKKKLQEALTTATNYLETSKLANVEFANELAELLVLANIPNSKKDELYARHIAAVKNISEVKGNITPTEVIEDDNGKAE